MGTAGAEGFGSSFHRLDTEDAGEDETIRDKDGETGHNDIDAHHNEKYQITDVVIVQEGWEEGACHRKKWLMILHHRKSVSMYFQREPWNEKMPSGNQAQGWNTL